MYAPLITSFLDKMDYGKLSWIHDLAIDRFDHASHVLLKEAEAERNLADQKVCPTCVLIFPFSLVNYVDHTEIWLLMLVSQIMLSLGKLCKVAQIDEGENLDSEKVLQEVESMLLLRLILISGIASTNFAHST